MATQVIALTSGSTWTVPSDWNSAANTIEAIGAGASGTSTVAGGGGAYAKLSNQTLTTGAVINIQVGSGDTWWNTSGTLLAKAGSGTAGGDAASCIPSTGAFSGGTTAGAGAGGAAGKNGAGNPNSGINGGSGDAGFGGAGGAGSFGAPGTPGGAGSEWSLTAGGTVGSGGGGGQGGPAGGQGGLYGGGGGNAPGGGAAGRQGLIVITYTPGAGAPPTNRFFY